MTLQRSVRAQLLAPALALLLAGCSSDYGGDWSLVYNMSKNYWNGVPPVSLAQASAVPYASIAVSVGDGPQAMFVLATANRDDLMWMAGQNVAVTTREGRIIRTSGLEHDLTGFSSNSTRSFTEMLRASDAQPDEWMADFADLGLYSVRVTCTWGSPSEAVITLLGADIHTTRIDEHCRAAAIGWSFTNSYWVDRSSGIVWRSYQHIRPDMDAIGIDLLRPPESR
jgi:hypothetical protein